MAIKIGDNFEYGGKKFLDSRQSFDTLEAMYAYPITSLPEGFIAFCKEDQKRYEFINNEWKEFTVSNIDMDNIDLSEYATIEYVDEAIKDVILDEGLNNNSDCSYFGDEEPEDEEQIWFSSSTSASYEITYDNPIINELFACIRTLQDQVKTLQAEVEYLKINGGGGIPEWPDMPGPDGPTVEDVYLALEDGDLFLWEDGGQIVLEEPEIIDVVRESVITLEDGGLFLLEEGGYILLEEQVIVVEDDIMLLEDGSHILWDDGSNIQLERNY